MVSADTFPVILESGWGHVRLCSGSLLTGHWRFNWQCRFFKNKQTNIVWARAASTAQGSSLCDFKGSCRSHFVPASCSNRFVASPTAQCQKPKGTGELWKVRGPCSKTSKVSRRQKVTLNNTNLQCSLNSAEVDTLLTALNGSSTGATDKACQQAAAGLNDHEKGSSQEKSPRRLKLAHWLIPRAVALHTWSQVWRVRTPAL